MKKQIITLAVCLLTYAANAQEEKKEKQIDPNAVNQEQAPSAPVSTEVAPVTNETPPAESTPASKEGKRMTQENKAVKMEKAKKEEEAKPVDQKQEVK